MRCMFHELLSRAERLGRHERTLLTKSRYGLGDHNKPGPEQDQLQALIVHQAQPCSTHTIALSATMPAMMRSVRRIRRA
jgi:hypothetical protein